MSDSGTGDTVTLYPCKLRDMPPTHPSLTDVAAAYRTLIAHETEPKEQDFYRTRLQRLEQATESVCELDCRNRVAAAGVGVYCPKCSAKCADTDLTTQLAKAIRAAWVDRLEWDELAHAALKFLTSTGRLLAADGLVLAGAEKAALKRLLAAQTGIVSRDVYEAIECLRALFPATEPAEERCQSVSIFRERCALVSGHDGRHAANGCAWGYPPAPAEPAEEETKAESHIEKSVRKGALAKLLEGILEADDDGWHLPNGWFPTDLAEAIVYAPASSPVVPAPTETGPWHAVAEIPKGVACIKDREGDVWRRCSSGWEHGALHDPVDYAPFVSAEGN